MYIAIVITSNDAVYLLIGFHAIIIEIFIRISGQNCKHSRQAMICVILFCYNKK